MGGTIILIMPILLFGVIWASHEIATKIYHLSPGKNNALLAIAARVFTFILSVLAFGTVLGILLFILITIRII